MFKFSKKIVSLASSLLAFTSLAGSAKAMDPVRVNPYEGYLRAIGPYGALNDPDGNTFKNAKNATQNEFDGYVRLLTFNERINPKTLSFYVVNRISNHPKIAITMAGATSVATALGIAYYLGAFDGRFGGKENNETYQNDFNIDESELISAVNPEDYCY